MADPYTSELQSDVETANYFAFTVKKLRALCKRRDIPLDKNYIKKAILIKYLQDYDNGFEFKPLTADAMDPVDDQTCFDHYITDALDEDQQKFMSSLKNRNRVVFTPNFPKENRHFVARFIMRSDFVYLYVNLPLRRTEWRVTDSSYRQKHVYRIYRNHMLICAIDPNTFDIIVTFKNKAGLNLKTGYYMFNDYGNIFMGTRNKNRSDRIRAMWDKYGLGSESLTKAKR